jgi:hypothetical protein
MLFVAGMFLANDSVLESPYESSAKLMTSIMREELSIIRASEFVRVEVSGYFELGAAKAALAKLVEACRKRGIDRALLDLRQLQTGSKPAFTSDDLTELGNTFSEAGFTHEQRLAILYKTDPYYRVRLFAFSSTMHGWAVEAFDDFEEALTWLSRERALESGCELRAGAKQIPVRFETPTDDLHGPYKRARWRGERASWPSACADW